MKALVASLLVFVVSFGACAGTSFIYVKNTSILANLEIGCVAKDDGVEISILNNKVRPRDVGVIKIESDQDGRNFEINLKTSNLDKTLKLKTQRDYFNNNGFVYNDDYEDDPISGDIRENNFYQKSSINV